MAEGTGSASAVATAAAAAAVDTVSKLKQEQVYSRFCWGGSSFLSRDTSWKAPITFKADVAATS